MNWNEIMSEERTGLVRNRYEITKKQHQELERLSKALNIPTSALIRLAISTFLPKTTNQNFTEKGIKNLWTENRF